MRSARCSSLYQRLNSASLSAGTSAHTMRSPVPFFACAIGDVPRARCEVGSPRLGLVGHPSELVKPSARPEVLDAGPHVRDRILGEARKLGPHEFGAFCRL